MKLADLSALCDLLRKKGVTEFEGTVEEIGVLKLRLGSADGEPVNLKAQVDEIKKEYRKMLDPQPRGNDGLTQMEQEDLYGQTVDDFESAKG